MEVRVQQGCCQGLRLNNRSYHFRVVAACPSHVEFGVLNRSDERFGGRANHLLMAIYILAQMSCIGRKLGTFRRISYVVVYL